MQLQRLTGLERQKILDELAALKKEIERLRTILGSRRLLMEIVVNELREIQEKFGDARRTTIVDDPGEIRIEDLIADEDMAITVSNTGYIKRTSLDSYSQQRRGGKGRRGMDLREEDFVSHIFVASTHAYIMIFSDRGRAYWLKVYEIPDVGPANRGKAIANLVSMEPGEKIAALLAVREFPAEDETSSSSSWARARAWSRRPTSRPTPTRAPAASSAWASRTTTRCSPCSRPTARARS